MVPSPIAVGLTLCEQVIVEEGTQNISLINTFTVWPMSSFPSAYRPFCAYCVLLDGDGDGTIQLTIIQEDTEDVIYDVRHTVNFPSPLAEVRILFRVEDCSFPAPGRYYATLSVDGESVAQRRFEVS
jgi:hypothetical protein